MRIGIMTFSNSDDNYGQLLQCWSLQYQLIKLGHDTFVIRYKKKNKFFTARRVIKLLLVYPKIKKVISYFHRRRAADISKIENSNNKRRFNDFRMERINFSPIEYHTINELRKNPPKADYYVAGSDTIWAQPLNDANNRAFFLDFGSEEIKRISYSASFLMKDYPSRWKCELKKLLARFDAISVREPEGVEICRDLGFHSLLTCDPTLLLSREEYLSYFRINENPSKSIYVYSLNVQDKSEIRWDEIKTLSEEKQYKIKVNVSSGMYPGYEIYGNDVDYDYCTIEKWIDNINNSSLVVSTSFHGVVFSIILETPFVYVPFSGEKGRLNARIFNILDKLGLSDRVLTTDKNYCELIGQQIDWKKVKERLNQFRGPSLDYLRNIT